MTLWQLLSGLDTAINLLFGGAALLAWFQRSRLRAWLMRNRFPRLGAGAARPWQAVVFTVSRPELPLWLMRHRRPVAVGLVATVHSLGAAEQITQEAQRMGVLVERRLVSNPDDPEETRRHVADLIGALRRRTSGFLAVDVTGGKTPMSIGAFAAAEEAGVDSIYVTADYDVALRRPLPDTAKITVLVSHPRPASSPGERGVGGGVG